MQQKVQKQNSFLDQAIDFGIKYKWILSITSGAVLALIAIFMFVNYITASNIEKASRMYDTSLNYINNINYITNEADRTKIYQEQINNLNTLVQIYPKTVAAIRARLFLGKFFYEDSFRSGKVDSMNTAVNYYSTALDNTKTGFYKSLALIGLGQCYEQKNDFNKSFDFYNQIVVKYPSEGFSPLALIGMARSKEMLGDVNTALDIYNRLIKEYPSSLWTKFAKGRIYFFSEKPKGNPASTSTNTGVPLLIQ